MKPGRRDPDASPPSPEREELSEHYSPEYLRECADGEARRERLEELKRRISARAYNVDADRIAEEILLRGDLGDG